MIFQEFKISEFGEFETTGAEENLPVANGKVRNSVRGNGGSDGRL